MKKIIVIWVVGVLSILMLIACPTPENNDDNKNKNNETDDGTPDIDIALIQTPIWEDDSEKDCGFLAGFYALNPTKVAMLFEPDGSFYYPSFKQLATDIICDSGNVKPEFFDYTRDLYKTKSTAGNTTGTYTVSGNTITATLANNTIIVMSYNSASGGSITVNSKTGTDTRIIVGRIFTILDAGSD